MSVLPSTDAAVTLVSASAGLGALAAAEPRSSLVAADVHCTMR